MLKNYKSQQSSSIYTPSHHIKPKTSDTEAEFLDLHLSISNDIVSTKIYANVAILVLKLSISHFLDGEYPCSTSNGVYISKLIRFARASSRVADFCTCNKTS